MRTDGQWTFVPTTAPLALSTVNGGSVSAPANPIDLLGYGVGVAPSGSIIGNVTLFGTDFGMASGPMIPKLEVFIGTAAATANAATLTAAWQFAPDTGAAGNYQPGAWQTAIQIDALTIAQLAAGSRICEWDFPKAFPFNERPRFTRLLFTNATGTAYTAGTISWAGITPNRDDAQNLQAARNYKVQ